MKLPVLKSTQNISGKRIFLRVDWNVPLVHGFAAEDSLKIQRSIATVKDLSSRGAIVIIATHLGRPKKRDLKLSTKKLLSIISEYACQTTFLEQSIDTAKGIKEIQGILKNAKQGSVFLLENVRFYSGEEKNEVKLAKAFASLADFYINDAFASCHRAHASVVGITKHVPSFAGPTLIEEVTALDKLITKPKKPFVAIIGGGKVSTKVSVLKFMCESADTVCIGGAMANVFFAAQGIDVGASTVEKSEIATAKRLLTKYASIMLPIDACVAHTFTPGAKVRVCDIRAIQKKESIGDIGPKTMQAWSRIIKKAQTIVWNGPLGITEIPVFSHGSRAIAQVIGSRSKSDCFGVAGGGDTLPVVLASKMAHWYDHLSTGGGAMLEFLAKQGNLPGIKALTVSKK